MAQADALGSGKSPTPRHDVSSAGPSTRATSTTGGSDSRRIHPTADIEHATEKRAAPRTSTVRSGTARFADKATTRPASTAVTGGVGANPVAIRPAAVQAKPIAAVNPVTDLVAGLMSRLVQLFGMKTPTPPANPLGRLLWGVFRSVNTALGFTPLPVAPTIGKPDEVTGTVTGTWGFTEPAGLPMTYTFTNATKGVVHVYTDGTYAYTPDSVTRQTATVGSTDSFTITAYDSVAATTQTITVPISPLTHTYGYVTTVSIVGDTAYGGAGVAVSSDNKYVYVTNSSSLVVINAETNTISTTIALDSPGGSRPGVAVDSHSGKVFVAGPWAGLPGGYGLGTFDPATGKASITGLDAADSGQVPTAVAVSPNGARVYVTITDGAAEGWVSVVDADSSEILTTIDVGRTPTAVVFSPDGQFAFVTNANTAANQQGTVTVIDTATDKVVKTITNVGYDAGDVAISPDGKTLYVVNRGAPTGSTAGVTLIDTTTRTVTTQIAVPTPVNVAVSPDGGTLYVTDSTGNQVAVVNPATKTVLPRPNSLTPTPGRSLWVTEAIDAAVSPDGRHLYVTSFAGLTVFSID